MKTLLAGVFLLAVSTLAFADVRVEITRDLPEEKQLVVFTFNDDDEFAMWMNSKTGDDATCDPYVSQIKIIRNWEPKEG